MFDQYFTIEKVVADKSNGIDGPKSFEIAIRFRVNTFNKNYPHIEKLLHRLKGMLNFKATVFDTKNRSIGTMKFAHNLQRQMIRGEKELVDDIKRFEQQLWKAFYLDYSRIKSLGFCGS